MTAGATTIRAATPSDLDEVKEWLLEEQQATDKGFYCNWGVIERASESGETFVMLRDGSTVAVLVDGVRGSGILTVRRDLRGGGLGGRFADWLFKRAFERNYSVLEIECEPRTSVPFWKKHGFHPMGEGPDGDRYAFKILERAFDLDAGPETSVTLALFPNEKAWNPATPEYWTRTERGRRHDDFVQLPARVALFDRRAQAMPDCVLRIDVDGIRIYEDKLKRPEAVRRGVERDPGYNYFIDRVTLIGP